MSKRIYLELDFGEVYKNIYINKVTKTGGKEKVTQL